MPLRVLIAYVLIAAMIVAIAAVYLHVTRERRAYQKCERDFRRARERKKRAAQKGSNSSGVRMFDAN
jgi:heme exporter protein D